MEIPKCHGCFRELPLAALSRVRGFEWVIFERDAVQGGRAHGEKGKRKKDRKNR